ncbi:PAS domain-containing sensor histidine kinase [Bacteroides sp. 519]|uniref:sensor histidine kinase n=1 Tax=Bacteroides sp. 519 TaxID=2302937 RepID=UPI0013D766EE|nr:ATP-binding protein [Bacteroides sp. 519]NDV60249.1 PAS domain-containing protein [Bacteroides sp. 519]
MRIKGLFVILAILILAIMGLLAYIGAHSKLWLFYTIEAVILITIGYLVFFYRKIVKPLHTIGNGMELLREQDFSSRLTRVGEEEADRIVAVFNKMMEQLKEERLRLREQNHFLDLLIEASPMGVLIVSMDGEITQCNPMALRILGISNTEVNGKYLSEIDSPLAAELLTIPRSETRTVRLNDANIYKCTHSSFIDHGFPHPFYLVESLTDEVIKAEKRAYEKVIRMIAHEVNNTTAGITSTLDTVDDALSEVSDTEDIREVMSVCIERCYSMSRFITRFADVVKIPEPHLSPVNLNDLAFTCKRFMEGMCAERNITISLDTAKVPEVYLDHSLFEQVLVNIIKNAAESIESNGEIIIRTASPASIEIIDNGKGISKDTEEKIFTPFFSTKPNGQGIGLIFIREVLTRHNCTFSLRTYSDGLTRFKISFEF